MSSVELNRLQKDLAQITEDVTHVAKVQQTANQAVQDTTIELARLTGQAQYIQGRIDALTGPKSEYRG